MLASLTEANFTGKRVIVRADLDVKINEQGHLEDESRMRELLPTLHAIYERGAEKVVLIGHRGRPEGQAKMEFSLEPLGSYLREHSRPDVAFIPHRPRPIFFETYDQYTQQPEKLILLENLRFYAEEEANDSAFAEELSLFGEVYVNEAFASSHRAHASIVALPTLMKAKNLVSVFAGLHLSKEITELSKLRQNSAHPIVFLVSGLKQDKLTFLPQLEALADQILIGGRLPEFLPEDQQNPKLLVAKLNPDKEDITVHTIEQFEQILATAKTIFVSGPMGKFEEPGQRLGTKRVFEAIAHAQAFKVAGGGDTTAAINLLNLSHSFDWISTGGGASLDFVAQGTLPGIDVLH